MKEADAIKISPLPTATQFRAWRLLVRDEVVAASERGQKAATWVMEVDSPDATYDLLAESGEFMSLHVKLAAALSKLASGDLGRKLTQAKEVEARMGVMLKGRQALWMVYEYYRVNAEAGALFDLSDLLNVKLRGDALEAFMANWDYVLVGMAVEPTADTLKVLFLDNLRGCPVMREEISSW